LAPLPFVPAEARAWCPIAIASATIMGRPRRLASVSTIGGWPKLGEMDPDVPIRVARQGEKVDTEFPEDESYDNASALIYMGSVTCF
jgi:hypothetical protein